MMSEKNKIDEKKLEENKPLEEKSEIVIDN